MIDCIKKIATQIIDELMDGQKYIDAAYKYRESHPELAELYKELSADELGHAEKLHEEGSKMIEGSDDHDSKVIWDWETERTNKWLKDIKVLHEMY